MSSAERSTTVTLRALSGEPLAQASIRDVVVATARAIAERQGVAVDAVDAQPDRVTITVRAGRIEAMGLAAELRRLTERWYAAKYGTNLWGE